jgi:hypothetical protein
MVNATNIANGRKYLDFINSSLLVLDEINSKMLQLNEKEVK